MLHPLGLVPKSKGLQCQFRGDRSQPIAIATLSSESDSNTFADEETVIFHTTILSVSLRT